MRYERAVMNIDGCAQPNPGPAGAGVIMKDTDGEVIFELSEPLRLDGQARWKGVELKYTGKNSRRNATVRGVLCSERQAYRYQEAV